MKHNERIATGNLDKNGQMIFVDDIVKVTYGDAIVNLSENEGWLLRMAYFILIIKMVLQLLIPLIIL